MTAKTYGSEVARAQLRTLIDEAMTGKAESVIERHGKPAAVLISYDRWLHLESEQEQKRKGNKETVPVADNAQPINILRTKQAEALAREEAAYHRLHPRLKTTHSGRYIAIYQSKLIDEDIELEAMVERVRSKYPDQVVWMTKVKDEPIQTMIKRGNRLLRNDE